MNLVEYGFRLPAAVDNRPLKFDEFEGLARQIIYVSATPADYELEKSEGIVVEQVIRPTGLLDPIIEVRPSLNQIDDLLEEIQLRIERDERVLVTTLTKRMAEELNAYLAKLDINCNYIHSDVDTLDRIKILDDLRAGVYDVLIGVNLLREGLDLPEVSLVAILDADKEGFLRSHRSLTQTVGRAARNLNGRVIMYADRITESMQKTIDETNRRREKQLAYNEENHITPQAIQKSKSSVLISNADTKQQAQPSKATKPTKAYSDEYREHVDIAADPIVKYMSKEQLQKAIERTRKQMVEAAKKMDFIEAAQYRDELIKLEDLYQKTTTTKERIDKAIGEIEIDLGKQVEFFKSIGKNLEAKRLYERVTYDVEMIREIGHCSGIENYSRYFDGREAGTRPFCLLDYFPKDFLTIIDESHVTVPQIRAMYGGDRSRKMNLVEYGFRLPAAVDNRPLKFDEFEGLARQIIYVSATPADYELEKSEGIVVEQVIRPTGLLDPIIEVRPSLNQIDDLLEEIQLRIERDERVLVTTLTKRMAEELNAYLAKLDINCNYIHSDVDTLDRIKILDDLRAGVYDVLIGVNLLREGLDLPEVSLVAILDADKEGFLRSHRSLTQTVGRAARNLNGRVIMYADRITESMQKTIDETNRRREKQLAYNEENHITPQAIQKSKSSVLISNADTKQQAQPSKATKPTKAYSDEYREHVDIAADPIVKYMSKEQLQKAIERTRKQMVEAAKKMDFIEAAQYRDELIKLEDLYQKTTTTT